jgi:hypothetical protein
MGESEVANRLRREGEAKGELRVMRQNLLQLLRAKYPGKVSEEMVLLIDQQEILGLLQKWFNAALRVDTYAEFVNELKG